MVRPNPFSATGGVSSGGTLYPTAPGDQVNPFLTGDGRGTGGLPPDGKAAAPGNPFVLPICDGPPGPAPVAPAPTQVDGVLGPAVPPTDAGTPSQPVPDLADERAAWAARDFVRFADLVRRIDGPTPERVNALLGERYGLFDQFRSAITGVDGVTVPNSPLELVGAYVDWARARSLDLDTVAQLSAEQLAFALGLHGAGHGGHVGPGHSLYLVHQWILFTAVNPAGLAPSPSTGASVVPVSSSLRAGSGGGSAGARHE